MWRSNHQVILSFFLLFLHCVRPDGTLEEHPEKYGPEVFYRNAYSPYQFIDDTGFTTREEYEEADACFSDQCNRGGFCYRLEDSTYSCDCLSTREGLNCEYAYVDFVDDSESSNYTEVPEMDPRCDDIDCNGNGECVLVNVGTLGLSKYEASCGCSMGYSEADNCLSWTGCDDIQCSSNGNCVEDELDGVKAVGCVCETGWTGTTCALGQRECTEGVLVNMVNQLATFDKEAAQTCADIWPFAPYVSTPTSICECLNAVAVNIPEFFDENTCIIDHQYYHGYHTLADIHSQYCSTCTAQEIEDSLQIIVAESTVCEYYHNYRQDMPLYMMSYWQCQCYATLGVTSEEVLPYLTCPMDTDNFLSTEMTSWASCQSKDDSEVDMEESAQGNKGVCAYEEIYEYIKNDLSDYSVKASESCGTAWQSLVSATDVEENFATYVGMFCDCFDMLNAYYPAGLDWFECLALTSHQATVKDLSNQYCYAPELNSQDCVSEGMRYATLLATNNDVRGSLTTFQALRAGAVADSLSDALNDLLCYAYNSGITLGLAESDMFNFQKCEDVAGFSWEYEFNCFADNEDVVIEVDDVSTIMEATMFTTGGGGNYWETQLRWASAGTLLGCVMFAVAGYKYGKASKPRRGLVFNSKVPYAQVDED